MKKGAYLLGFFVLLASSSLFAAEADQLYQQGLQAYNTEDYLSASEHLFAYRQIAGAELTGNFRLQLEEALNYSEAQIRVAIETKRELDKHGKITQIVVETSGKADTANAQKKTKNFHAPADVNRRKPNLPSKPATPPKVAVISGTMMTPNLAPITAEAAKKPDLKMKDVSVAKELEKERKKSELLIEQLKRCRMKKNK